MRMQLTAIILGMGLVGTAGAGAALAPAGLEWRRAATRLPPLDVGKAVPRGNGRGQRPQVELSK